MIDEDDDPQLLDQVFDDAIIETENRARLLTEEKQSYQQELHALNNELMEEKQRSSVLQAKLQQSQQKKHRRNKSSNDQDDVIFVDFVGRQGVRANTTFASTQQMLSGIEENVEPTSARNSQHGITFINPDFYGTSPSTVMQTQQQQTYVVAQNFSQSSNLIQQSSGVSQSNQRLPQNRSSGGTTNNNTNIQLQVMNSQSPNWQQLLSSPQNNSNGLSEKSANYHEKRFANGHMERIPELKFESKMQSQMTSVQPTPRSSHEMEDSTKVNPVRQHCDADNSMEYTGRISRGSTYARDHHASPGNGLEEGAQNSYRKSRGSPKKVETKDEAVNTETPEEEKARDKACNCSIF